MGLIVQEAAARVVAGCCCDIYRSAACVLCSVLSAGNGREVCGGGGVGRTLLRLVKLLITLPTLTAFNHLSVDVYGLCDGCGLFICGMLPYRLYS